LVWAAKLMSESENFVVFEKEDPERWEYRWTSCSWSSKAWIAGHGRRMRNVSGQEGGLGRNVSWYVIDRNVNENVISQQSCWRRIQRIPINNWKLQRPTFILSCLNQTRNIHFWPPNHQKMIIKFI
jgi:hypothetical protein